MGATTVAPAPWPWVAAARCAAASDDSTRNHQRNRGRAAMLCPAQFWRMFLSDQFRKQVGVDIAAGQNDDDVPALGIDAASEQCGAPDPPAGFAPEAQLA